jgi:adenine-specific DNA-methyltransferase
LVIELDGGQHGLPPNRIKDRFRSARFERDGFRVLRYWNNDLIENFDGVLEGIWRELGV